MKSISGHKVIKALTKIGFEFVKQRGSHVKLKKTTNNGKRIVIVPLHKDLPDGTLHSISRQAGLTYKEFKSLFNN
ncbi:MAG: type II toxin-antitoxin system HicA family toxin [Theionarchaea archaeon]|nr:type II toxin-antitoxin system HicA family toxin [Theionarchaea archaeon]